mgnify:CR=1 FL=1
MAWVLWRIAAIIAASAPEFGKSGNSLAMKGALDSLDRKLLACLQLDNLQTADRLSEQVGLSPSAVARRLRRLRVEGAVAADVAILSDAAAGHPLSMVIHVQLETHQPDEGRSFRKRLLASENVQLVLDVSGAFDILLLVVAPDMAAFNAFCETTLETPGVRRYETSLVKKQHKATLAVPAPQD